jgi:hypothetical protein
MSYGTTDTFNLYVRETGDRQYVVTADDPTGPQATVHFTAGDEFKTALLKLHARGADRVLRSIPEQDPVSSVVGEELFTTFIKGPKGTAVSLAFDKFIAAHDPEVPQRIALHLPRSLYRLPWELLRDPKQPPGDFLSLFHSLIRVDLELEARDDENDPRYTRFPPIDPTLHLLFVVASPSDRPIGDFEPGDTGDVSFHRVSPATYGNFQSFTSRSSIRPDGFVFLGHGDIADKFGALVFVRWQGVIFRTTVSDPRSGYAVSSDLARRERLRLACVLACESAWVGDDLPFEHCVVGSILNRTKMPFVLGAQGPISVYAAQEFLTGMVQALHEKVPLDAAITRGRRSIHASPSVPGTYTALDWWIPVLYSRTTSFEVIADSPGVPIPVATRSF